MHPFKYFLGPADDMAGLVTGLAVCSFCGETAECFELKGALKKEPSAADAVGCSACLASGRFSFRHETEAHSKISAEASEELSRTPPILTWQGERWLTHCDDFMAYVGTWEPTDFVTAAPEAPRELFEKMTRDPALRFLWADSLDQGETTPIWNATYYVFRCLHCDELAGSWDCDQS